MIKRITAGFVACAGKRLAVLLPLLVIVADIINVGIVIINEEKRA